MCAYQGHTGPLCGSCKDGYGKSYGLVCQECFVGVGNVVLVLLSLFMLLALSSFTVRSNLTSLVRLRPHRSQGIRQRSPGDPSTEIGCETSEGEAVRYETPPECSVRVGEGSAGGQPQAVAEAELRKWKAAEVFKVRLSSLRGGRFPVLRRSR